MVKTLTLTLTLTLALTLTHPHPQCPHPSEPTVAYTPAAGTALDQAQEAALTPPPTTTSPPPTTTTNPDQSPLTGAASDDAGAIAGGVVGGVLFLGALGGYFAWRSRRGARSGSSATKKPWNKKGDNVTIEFPHDTTRDTRASTTQHIVSDTF